MTTEKQTTKAKRLPDFYIFNLENPEILHQVGAIFLCDPNDEENQENHTVYIHGKRYAAFSPDEAQGLEMTYWNKK